MDIIAEIKRLKTEKNAVILAHNYQRPEIQDIADFVGDSLQLSRLAADTDADIIVFCGVMFMAETAKILSPHKKVLIPDPNAGCPMADMITARDVRTLRQTHPNAKVFCYINSSADVKGECDYCVTSANAEKVVEKYLKDGEEAIFVPDKYLGSHVARKTGKDLILFDGYCPTHARILASHVKSMKQEHPTALVMAHPECRIEVCELADAVLSTGAMLAFAKESPAKEFLVATEIGMLHRLRQENPGKTFIPVTEYAECLNMKKTTLENLYNALLNEEYEVNLSETEMVRARSTIANLLDK